ncbi:MAG: Nif3-like dinuclear metal center hexameric protein [Actinomycetaceae bacterium]|nr:Nif3-like dinuclear metal center hexameric protein [Actinomycetaceae bacterium]
MTYTVGLVTDVLDGLYPKDLAESWDRVGLSVGSYSAPCSSVLLAVDPCEVTIDEAIDRGVDMLITHHPLLLRGTHAITSDTAKGRWIMTLLSNNIHLFSAHTNADIVHSTQALAQLLDVNIERPLDAVTGIGGIGNVMSPVSLKDFAARVSSVLPSTPAGVLYAGDDDAMIERVAICSGAGDSFLSHLQGEKVDAYITADIRHHPASDHIWNGGAALICPTHWASEWPLLTLMKEALEDKLPHLDVHISTVPTDVWKTVGEQR